MSQTPFSYAQAAKGQAASQAAPQPTTSPAPPSVSSQGKDDATTASTAATILSTTSAENDVNDSAKQSKIDDEPAAQQQQTETSTVTAHIVGESTSNTVTNGHSAAAEPAQAASEEKSRRRSPSRTSRSAEPEARKGRKGKKGRNHDKDNDADKAQEDKEEKEPAKQPVILSEAPIPSVNIWHKRREAHAAKAKTPADGTSAHTAQVDDSKKRDEKDLQTAAHNGTNGEKSHHKKSVDISRAAEQLPRRSAPRGSRVAEKDEKSGAASLPPVADSALWPDVKSAVAADEFKKPQEKAERAEKDAQDGAASSKRSKKPEWVAVPYVPTAVFNTPLPQRSSKPRGGARGGRESGTTRAANSNSANAGAAPATSPTADKAQSAANTAPAKEGRPRGGSGSARANSLPPNASKRESTDATFVRDARKPSAPAATDRPGDQASDVQSSGTAKAENGQRVSQAGSEQQSQFASRNFSDRRGEAGFKGYEAGIPTPKEQNFAGRERSEGQSRGRGGFRARGGHNASAAAGHQQAGYAVNGQYPVHPIPGRQNGPYSPPAHQNAFGNAFPGGSTRGGGRGNGRGASSSFGRVNSNGAGPGRMPPVNAPNVPYDFQMAQYGAYPPMQLQPQPVYDNTVVSVLTNQIEYYLSIENLLKDMYLRRHMDSQGFVTFDLIAGFQRVKMLAPDVDHIRIACEVSDKIDYVVGDDGIERLRARDNWHTFVQPMDDRVEQARNDGPASFYMRSRHSSAPFVAPVVPVAYHATSPNMFPGNFPPEEQMYQQQYMNGTHYDTGVNGGDMNGHRYAPDTQLSAAVPEFAPSVSGVQAGGVQQTPFTLDGATTFLDEQIEGLFLVVTDKKETSTPVVVNGTNGVTSPPAEVQSPKNIVWAVDHKPTSLGAQVRYVDLRKKAFDQRDATKAGDTSRDMQNLYNFWAHFLVHSFNAGMYHEFRSCAIEDAAKQPPARYGLNYLLQFYNELLNGDKQKPWGNDRSVPEIVKLHHQEALDLLS